MKDIYYRETHHTNLDRLELMFLVFFVLLILPGCKTSSSSSLSISNGVVIDAYEDPFPQVLQLDYRSKIQDDSVSTCGMVIIDQVEIPKLFLEKSSDKLKQLGVKFYIASTVRHCVIERNYVDREEYFETIRGFSAYYDGKPNNLSKVKIHPFAIRTSSELLGTEVEGSDSLEDLRLEQVVLLVSAFSIDGNEFQLPTSLIADKPPPEGAIIEFVGFGGESLILQKSGTFASRGTGVKRLGRSVVEKESFSQDSLTIFSNISSPDTRSVPLHGDSGGGLFWNRRLVGNAIKLDGQVVEVGGKYRFEGNAIYSNVRGSVFDELVDQLGYVSNWSGKGLSKGKKVLSNHTCEFNNKDAFFRNVDHRLACSGLAIVVSYRRKGVVETKKIILDPFLENTDLDFISGYEVSKFPSQVKKSPFERSRGQVMVFPSEVLSLKVLEQKP